MGLSHTVFFCNTLVILKTFKSLVGYSIYLNTKFCIGLFMKRLILTISLLLTSSFTAYSQGLDLNPALLGCIMGGGDCLTNTGIKFIDDFFSRDGKHEPYTRKDECYDLRYSWCAGNGRHIHHSGFMACREAKQAFYKQKAQKDGTWPEHIGPAGYPPTEWDYFRSIEDRKSWSPPYTKHFFTCDAKQRIIYMKARCGKDYMDWRDIPDETIDCFED